MCLYNLHTKLEIETGKVWGQSALNNFKSYLAVDKVAAAAIEAFTSWKSPSGYYVFVDFATAVQQLEALRERFWRLAFPNRPAQGRAFDSDYGQTAFVEFARCLNEVQRGLGKDCMRVPVDSADYTLLHAGVMEIAPGIQSVCGVTNLTHQSELICRLLELRRYRREGVAYSYIPYDETDFDSVHFTAGFCSGRGWSRADAMFQLRSAVCLGQNRIA